MRSCVDAWLDGDAMCGYTPASYAYVHRYTFARAPPRLLLGGVDVGLEQRHEVQVELVLVHHLEDHGALVLGLEELLQTLHGAEHGARGLVHEPDELRGHREERLELALLLRVRLLLSGIREVREEFILRRRAPTGI